MVVHASRRLVRFVGVSALALVIIFAVGNSGGRGGKVDEADGSSYLSNYIIDFSNFFPSSSNETQSDSFLSSAEKEAERERQLLEAGGVAQPSAAAVVDEDPAYTKALEQAKKLAADSVQNGGKNSTLKFMSPSYVNAGRKPKACFFTWVTDEEDSDFLPGILKSIQSINEHFNTNFHYPWVFISRTELSETFQVSVSKEIAKSGGTVEFGVAPETAWRYPGWIDHNKAATARVQMHELEHGSSESHRQIQRYLAGPIWKHPVLEKYDWYWNVEPNIELYCEVQYDAFRWMQDTGRVFGFTISYEAEHKAFPTLWDTVKEFIKRHPDFAEPDDKNLMKMITSDNKYNNCQIWSSFEIGNINFWRSPAYQAYFDFLDHKGGFYYELWEVSPVHTLALAFLLEKERVHYFPELGYHAGSYDNCPIDDFLWQDNRCKCDQGNDFTFKKGSCGTNYYDAMGKPKPDGWKDR